MQSFKTPRALCVLDENAPFGFRIWLSGSWGLETRTQLVAVLHRMPQLAGKVNVDCRRVTLIDPATLGAMTEFAGECEDRRIPCTFECDDDPVGRLISIAGLDRLTVLHRPLHQRPAQTL